jgi:hypothetical protein
MKNYYVICFDNQNFKGIISGMGRNKGTWDYHHSRSVAYKHCKGLNNKKDGFVYKVEKD